MSTFINLINRRMKDDGWELVKIEPHDLGLPDRHFRLTYKMGPVTLTLDSILVDDNSWAKCTFVSQYVWWNEVREFEVRGEAKLRFHRHECYEIELGSPV